MDLVIGAITNYNFSHIKAWVNSLDRCGYTGHKALLCYNIDYATTTELVERGYTILAFERDDENKTFRYKDPNFNIVQQRFIHMYYYLGKMDQQFRYMISTDVKDVVFQRNPSEWLERHLGEKKINVASESIRYEHEQWGRNNLQLSFGPMIYDEHKTNLIYNAGTVSGDFAALRELFLNIFLVTMGAPSHIPGGGGADQAALNILLQMSAYRAITRFTTSEEGWAAQCGTTVDPAKIAMYRSFLAEPSPIMKDNLVCTSIGEPFYLVHQYDRVAPWKNIIEEKYA